MSYKKLVRDKIPDIIINNGEKPIIRILSLEEYKMELERKLEEETKEVLKSNENERLEELADLLEVMIALAKLDGSDLNDIEKECILKREKRGAFSKRIYLEGVEK